MNGLTLLLILVAFVLGCLVRGREIATLKDENAELRHRLWHKLWAGSDLDVATRRPAVRRPA